MPLRPIVIYPDERLRLVSQPVLFPATDEIRSLVDDMAETMYARDGAGLAAIQVGEPVRIFIVDAAIAGGTEEDPPIVFINPELVWLSEEQETADEGCLSFPGIYVPVKRSLRARVRAADLSGQLFELEGQGLLARAFQHESNHLDGRLLADYVGRIKRQMITRKLTRYQQDDDQD